MIALILVSGTVQELCFDTMCWSVNQSSNISCDHRTSHCGLDPAGNPRCIPGSTDVGVACNTTNKYYHCLCQQDTYGQAYCDCKGAMFFWSVIGAMGAMFLLVQLWLACIYCKNRKRSTPPSNTLQTAVAEQENYGATADNAANPVIAGGVRVFPADIEQLLPPEPGDPHFGANAPPPTYSEVTTAAPGFYNPPTNPYFNQLT